MGRLEVVVVVVGRRAFDVFPSPSRSSSTEMYVEDRFGLEKVYLMSVIA